ncbi:hypothetical protein CBP51_20245 [Cellvibrio mixtus]|uniref:Uncharacterized protein n=1 Tax=Cellvibrio mixtus TaxID=39650 RepID=A0A266Q1J0_9GAMM|nr:hypothetical protein CBP51_20245 [Cellvibrio mixtus]
MDYFFQFINKKLCALSFLCFSQAIDHKQIFFVRIVLSSILKNSYKEKTEAQKSIADRKLAGNLQTHPSNRSSPITIKLIICNYTRLQHRTDQLQRLIIANKTKISLYISAVFTAPMLQQ